MLNSIRTKKEYEAAVENIYELMQKDIKENSHDYNELGVLSILVDNYESRNFPIDLPDPIEAIKFRLEQLNLNTSALKSIIGANRITEIMSRKRKLSISNSSAPPAPLRETFPRRGLGNAEKKYYQ
jgi:HTH-type transcriptional regulator/antitoxin HigA